MAAPRTLFIRDRRTSEPAWRSSTGSCTSPGRRTRTRPPFYGWIVGYTYNGSAFAQTYVLNVTPNVGDGGIWMSGGAIAADSSNNLYAITGNGTFDANAANPPNNDYGDSLLELNAVLPGSLAVSQYFTPSDQLSDAQDDNDFGSGGAAVLADLPAGSPVTHLVMGGGKDGNLYVLNRDMLGGLGDGFAVQEISFGGPIYSHRGVLEQQFLYCRRRCVSDCVFARYVGPEIQCRVVFGGHLQLSGQYAVGLGRGHAKRNRLGLGQQPLLHTSVTGVRSGRASRL